MTISAELEARWQKLLTSYPEGKQRSAMIPMLMYAQDEMGFVSEDLVQEVARRIGCKPIDVEATLTYYSMLHYKKPLGKYHVQICTNISCLLVGGQELWERACKKTGLDHKKVSADGVVSLEDVECMGACSWAPAIQINYDFHHNVTGEQLDSLLDQVAAKQYQCTVGNLKKTQ